MLTKILGVFLSGLLIGAAGCGSSASKTAAVKIQVIGTEQIEYWRPVEVRISTGGVVTWTNTGSNTRNIISDEGLFNKSLPPGQTFQYTFTREGTFTYHDEPNLETCTVVVVK